MLSDISNRLKIYVVPWKNVMAALTNWRQVGISVIELMAMHLPEDAKVVSVHHNHFSRSFEYTVKSETFEPVLIGETIPKVHATYYFYTLDINNPKGGPIAPGEPPPNPSTQPQTPNPHDHTHQVYPDQVAGPQSINSVPNFHGTTLAWAELAKQRHQSEEEKAKEEAYDREKKHF